MGRWLGRRIFRRRCFWIGEGSDGRERLEREVDSGPTAGPDSPSNRNGYAAGTHASSVNTFYVALPFNDLTYPEKGPALASARLAATPRPMRRRHRPARTGGSRVKNAHGDVLLRDNGRTSGPFRSDDAEYVFGSNPPKDKNAGISVSPAVAEYLALNDKNPVVSWRFSNAEDVRPGPWLKLDEQAVIFTALHEQNK